MKRTVYAAVIAIMSIALYSAVALAEGLKATIGTTQITIDTNPNPVKEVKADAQSVKTENEKKQEKEKERKHKDKDREDD